MAGWPDGRMAGWMAGWPDGWLDGWTAGRLDGQTGRQADVAVSVEKIFYDDRPSLQSQIGCVKQDSTNVGLQVYSAVRYSLAASTIILL